jgi:hypothetical protein
MNTNHRPRRSAQRLLFALAFLLLLTGSSLATDGTLGSVSSPSQTSSSITVTWTPPTGDYSYCTSPHEYKVCIKESGNLQIACNQEPDYTSGSSYTFDNIGGSSLASDTLHRIEVYVMATKNGHNCKLRAVGMIKQATWAAVPPFIDPLPHLSLSSQAGGFVATTHFAPGPGVSPTGVRVCYKRTWWPENLKEVCKNPWATNNDVRGSGYVAYPAIDQIVPFSALPNCKQYRVVAYGYPGDVFLGEGSIETGGDCKKVATDLSSEFILEQLISHHIEVAQQYQSATDQYLKGQGKRNGLIDMLTTCDRAVASELQMLAADSETVTTDADLLDYVFTREPSLLGCWQSSVPRNLTLEPFLSANYPTVLDQIRGDLDPPR